MSQVLEKPVLLDETGQAIVGKLDNIKEAIENGGVERYPVLIHVTKMPTKISYIAGEQLDLSGLEVKAVFSNNAEYDVTSQCTFIPANGTALTSSDTTITVSYMWHPTSTLFQTTFSVSIKTITGIEVVTPPAKVSYMVGDTLDLSGIVVNVNYGDNTSENITSQCTFSPANGSTLDSDQVNVVNISYIRTGVSYSTTQSISVVSPIYGAEWDGTASSAWTRTDAAADFVDPNPYYDGMTSSPSSPFDSIMPWAGMTRVEDENAGTLVQIPKYYYKWTIDGSKMKLQISPIQQSGFLISPAHADRGDNQGERDYVYVGAYLCSQTGLKSTSGVLPIQNGRIGNNRTSIHNLGSDVWQYDYAMYWTIAMLYIVEYADWNSQSKIGFGGYRNSSQYGMSGACDVFDYHTGTTSSDRTTGGRVKYRNIEDLWSNSFVWVDGIYVSGSSVYCINNPASFSNSSGGTETNTRPTSNGQTKSMRVSTVPGFEYAVFPSSLNTPSDYDTYICDGYSWNSSNNTSILTGGSHTTVTKSIGLFTIICEDPLTSTDVSSRLMQLKANS